MTSEQKEQPLESWKEIAAYLKRDATTVRRWEKSQGLPVHRHLHEARSSVFAYPSELDAWWAGRTPAERAQEQDAAPPRNRILRVAGLAAAILLAVAAAGDGLVRPVQTSAQGPGIAARQLWAGRLVDTTGQVAPGGRELSFVDWETGDLAIRSLASGESRRLTNKGTWTDSYEFALFSTFSPDGRQLAYGWFTKDMTFQLRVLDVGGGAPRVLHAQPDVSHLQPSAWSPDGAHVLALVTRENNTNEIALVSAADGSARVLKSVDFRYPLMPALSPDGRFVAFDFPPKVDAPQRDIYLISADGSREVALVQHAANDFLPAWAPDGRSLVFLSDRAGNVGLWMIPVADGRAGGPPRLLKADVGRVSAMKFDRSGSLYYALETGMTDVYVASIDFSSGMTVDAPAPVTQTFVGANRGADWSPDGKHLSYLSQRATGPAATRNPSIVIRAVDTGAERTLNLDVTRTSRPRWSPDGRRLLVYAQDRQGRRGMYAIDPQTGASSLLFTMPGEGYAPAPAWSADGRAVFYTFPGDGTFLFRMRTVTPAGERVLFRGNAQNIAPSPDGRSVAFTYAADTKVSESRLVVLSLDGGTPREVAVARHPEGFAADSVVWTPDGRYLLFAKRSADGSNSVWRVRAEGGEPQKLHLATEGANIGLRVHPDGRRIAFTSGERTSEIWVLENVLPAAR